jgi:outer membrane protein assembly factor BamB/outer membrane protein assembly factor BamD (BamD/ComL family)
MIWRFSTALIVLLPAHFSFAQQNNPSSLLARDPSEGVYVRDSAVAAEKMALAFRLEHLNEWNKAADVYQELLQQYADRVTPSDDKDQQIYQYTSITIAVQQKLAKWPQEGLDTYRARYETEAASLLQQAGTDPVQLHKIVAQYFITDSAKQAAIRLIDSDMESGDFASAAWMGDRLLQLHPNISAERPMLLYRTALAYRLAGNDALAQARADELKKDFPDATGTIEGKDVALSKSLDEQLTRAKPIVEAARPDSWPMLFGSPDRSRIPNVSGFGGAKIFSIDLTKENLKTIQNPAARQQMLQENKRARDEGMMTGVMPVVDHGELFFQDNARVYALSLDSGLPLAGWASTYDGDRNGRYAITAWSTPRNTQYTLALTDDSVLGIMGQVDWPTMLAGMAFTQRDTRLVCLDRHSGKERWVVRPSNLPTESLQGLEFSGTPLVVNDNVFVTAHSSAGVQFQDCYLLCFDTAGRYRYATYIASANSGAAIFDGDFGNVNQDVPQLAYSSGRVFVLSNVGALAAVDAYDGTIVWLNLYQRQQNNDVVRQFGFRGGWGRVQTQPDNERPWTSSPVVVADGKIFALPTDGTNLFIYDAGTGAEIKHIRLSQIDPATTILGVIDDRIVLVGSSGDGQDERIRVICLNWRNYDMMNFPGDNSIVWKATYTDKDPGRSGLRGRGFLTTDSVYVPTQNKLLKIDLKGGKIMATYPEGDRTWDSSESAGNILVTQDHLIVAGAERVNVYTDLSLAKAKLDKEVAAAPEDPDARLRYAEVMFVAGETDLAVAKLDEAIGVIGGLDKATDAAARDRIYACAMAFAEKLSHEQADSSGQIITGLYDRAAKAASSAQQQVNYRISRARFAKDTGDDATQLKLLQEIVANPTWRAVPVVQQDSAGPALAATVAEKQIADLIERSPKVYEPVAAEAQKAFEDAQTSADPAKLLSVAQTYPNAPVAPQALLKAADAYEAVGNPRQAGQILRQLYFKYPNSPDRAVIIEALARNYLATPNHLDVAIARLEQGAKLPGEPRLTRPLVLSDGTVIKDMSFVDALEALRKYHEQATAKALPDFNIPAPANVHNGKGFVRPTDAAAAHITAIVPPLRDFSRNDRLVTFTLGSGVSVWQVGAAQPMFTSRAIMETPLGCAWQGDTLLVWSAGRIVMIKSDGSASAWETELRTIPIVEVATRDDSETPPDDEGNFAGQININGNGQIIFLQGRQRIVRGAAGFMRIRAQLNANAPALVPVGAEQIVKVAVVSDRAILATSSGRIIALDLADGKTIWQMRPSDRQVDQLLATDDFVVAHFNDGSQIRVIALDTYSGQSVMHREFPADGTGLVNLALASDGKLIYLLIDRIECKDLFEPGDRLAYSIQVRRSDGNGAFMGAIQPDQLALSNGRIIAISDEGRFMRVYSLEDGHVLHSPGAPVAEGIDNTVGLKTKAADWQVTLATAGSYVYAFGPHSLVGYNLDQLGDTPYDPLAKDDEAQNLVIGKDYLLLMAKNVPSDRPLLHTQFPTSLAACSYSRAVTHDGRESGLFAARDIISNPAGIQSWQPVDGGLYYLAGDGKLFFMQGARK